MDDPDAWNYFPVIESGVGTELAWMFSTSEPEMYVRLIYTDIPTGNPFTADFDGDGVSNWFEVNDLNSQGNSPFLADSDGDGILDFDEDSDDDGFTDGEEEGLGTDPVDSGDLPDTSDNPEPAPGETYQLTVEGDAAVDVPTNDTETVTIPAGSPTSWLLVVAVDSDEFPRYTREQSQYNDTVDWELQIDGVVESSGNTEVNLHHEPWLTSLAEGTVFRGYKPVSFVKVQVIEIPDLELNPVSADLSLTVTNIEDGDLPTTAIMALLPIEIKDVEFYANQTVKRDDGTGDYTGKDWLDSNDDRDAEDHLEGDQKWPVCYVKGDTMGVSSKLKVTGGDGIKLKAKAKAIANNLKNNGQDEILLESEDEYTIQGDFLTIPRIDANSPLNNQIVNHDSEMKIEWELAHEDEAFVKAAESDHSIYVLFRSPAYPDKLFRSVVHLAASEPGATTDAEVLTDVWSHFSDGNGPEDVQLWNENTQEYDRDSFYYPWGIAQAACPTNTADFLASNVAGNFGEGALGQCSAFQFLFMDALAANGLGAIQRVSISWTWDPNSEEGSPFDPLWMNVENWTYKNPTSSPVAPYPVAMPWGDIHLNPNSEAPVDNDFGGLRSEAGVPGQGTATPYYKFFGNHAIVRVQNKYYDPSYGVTYDTIQDVPISGLTSFNPAPINGILSGVSLRRIDQAWEIIEFIPIDFYN